MHPYLLHQGTDVRTGAGGQRLQVVATFQCGDQPPAGVRMRQVDQALGDPGIVLGLQLQIGQRIALVGVEAGRDQHQLRLERMQSGQQV